MLFLLAGLSNFTSAQIFGRHESSETNAKRVKVKKHQMFHFEKQTKDNNVVHNGTALKREKYAVDKVSFSSVTPLYNNRRFIGGGKLHQKEYEARLIKTVYSRKRPRLRYWI